jgi:RND family efflux transporter MFP subunit
MAGCGEPPVAVKPPEPPVVTVAVVTERDFPPYVEFTGRTDAVKAVDIVPEVSGILVKINFQEGKLVKQGDVLYEIDPVPYKAVLDRAKADAASAKASLAFAESELARMRSAGAAVSKNEVDKAVASRDSSAAQLQAAEADIEKANFNYEKTKVLSPIAGRIARTTLTEGNLVSANATRLTRIVSVNPIYVLFDVDEMTSLRYRDMIYKTKTVPDPRDDLSKLRCWVRLNNEKAFSREGHVDYVDPEVNRSSVTRRVRGVIPNEDAYMTPGEPVRVRAEAGPSQKAVMIPEVAIGSQQRQKYVYVVNGKNEAEFRPVELGEARDGLWVVEQGLKPNERIVVNGLLRVRPGAVVKPVEQSESTKK